MAKKVNSNSQQKQESNIELIGCADTKFSPKDRSEIEETMRCMIDKRRETDEKHQQNKPVPNEFSLYSSKNGEITGTQREQIYNVLDSSVDTFLAAKAKQRAECGKYKNIQ